MSKLWLSPTISWKVFKKINDLFQDDLVMEHGDEILWEMLRDRQINMYISTDKKDKDDPMCITVNPIKGGKIIKDY